MTSALTLAAVVAMMAMEAVAAPVKGSRLLPNLIAVVAFGVAAAQLINAARAFG